MMIDAVAYHDGDGADTEEHAAWHIGVFFVRWCARNGMLAPKHAAAAAIADPIRFLLYQCGGKLYDSDLTAAGNRFARHVYDDYLRQVDELATLDGDRLLDYLDEKYGS